MDIIQLCPNCIGQTVILILVANGSPVIASKLFGNRYNVPIDLKLTLSDGNYLFGYSKTWRGFCSAVAGTMIAAPIMGSSFFIGAWFGFLAMLGDLLSSFIKRRMGFIESSRTLGLDVVPEALLPLLVLHNKFGLNWLDMIAVVVLFFLVETFVSPILYHFHIRKRPY